MSKNGVSHLLDRTCTTWVGDGGACGVSRTRTGDPLLAKQVLYPLSYNPA